MVKIPRIFIGTMFCNEGDFEECLNAIHSQIGVAIDHKIISNEPEQKAHNMLWGSFNDAALNGGYDMLTKIDADTVLAHPYVLDQIFRLFESNPRVTSIQAPLHDYFTDGMINGLNNFMPRVKFNSAPELFCDRVDTGHDIQLLAKSCPATITPAGLHCHSANEVQAFHYGLHRALKHQWDLLRKVKAAYQAHNDIIRRYALMGVEASGQFGDHKGFNYSDERFIEAFKKAEEIINENSSPYGQS